MDCATITIGNRKIGAGYPTFFIAEVASAHEGDFTVARKMIDVAVEAKADAIKFQFFRKEAYMIPAHPIYSLAERIEFTAEQWKELREYAQHKSILFVADTFDLPSGDVAAQLDVDALKIHSSDLTNPELIERVAQKGKPVFLGIGATTMDEITAAITLIRKYHNNIIVMHGYQAFPTKLSEINFNFVKTLKAAYGLPVGILDHTEGETFMSTVVPLLTPFVGAEVIEKHFTLDRSRKGIDYESSVNPDTLKSIVENLRLIETTLGSGWPPFHFSPDEQGYRDLMKKTIVAERDIPLGMELTPEHIAFKRAGPGLRPLDAHLLIGKRAREDLKRHQVITVDQVTPDPVHGDRMTESQRVKPRVGILIACRMKSSRLPRKALLPIVGKPLIDHLIERVKTAQQVDEVILCTSTHPDDALLEDAATRNKIRFFRGAEEDVLGRFIAAAEKYNLDIVVRVTGDNPLTDPEYIDKVIVGHLQTKADFSKVEQLPLGVNCEVISRSTLKKAHELAADPNLSEYMTAYLKQPKHFTINMVEAEPFLKHPEIRLTVDVAEDLQLMEEIYRRLYSPPGRIFSLRETIKLLVDDEPQLININRHVPERALPKIIMKDDSVADKPKIVLLGAAMDGAAGKVLDIIEQHCQFNVVGLVDEHPDQGHTAFRGIPVLGGLDEFILKIPPGTEGFFIGSDDLQFRAKAQRLVQQYQLQLVEI